MRLPIVVIPPKANMTSLLEYPSLQIYHSNERWATRILPNYIFIDRVLKRGNYWQGGEEQEIAGLTPFTHAFRENSVNIAMKLSSPSIYPSTHQSGIQFFHAGLWRHSKNRIEMMFIYYENLIVSEFPNVYNIQKTFQKIGRRKGRYWDYHWVRYTFPLGHHEVRAASITSHNSVSLRTGRCK